MWRQNPPQGVGCLFPTLSKLMTSRMRFIYVCRRHPVEGGLTPISCRAALCTEPGRTPARPSVSHHRCLHHRWVEMFHVMMQMQARGCDTPVGIRLLHNPADKRRQPVRDQQLSGAGAEYIWIPWVPGPFCATVPLPFHRWVFYF